MVRSQLLRLVLVAAFSVSQLASVAARADLPVASSASVDPDYAPLVDSVEADYLRTTTELTHYEVVAEMTPVDSQSNASITGKTTITYVNHTGAPLTEIYFRLYPNSAEYAEGRMTVSRIRVDGQKATSTLGQDDTLLSVALPNPAAVGSTIKLSFRFATTIPTDPRRSYGMFKYDSDTHTYSLAHWQPLLAGWDREHGWNTAPVSKNGDPVFTEAAVFDVTLTAPSSLIFATSGSVLDQSNGDTVTATTHYASGPSRDFVIAASTDFVVTEEIVGETTVRSFAWPGSEEGSQRVLESGAKALKLYNDLIGLYPYEELDLVQVNIGNGAGGVEFPGLVYIGASFYDLASGNVDPDFLEFVVVHEVAHQWFYNVVGNNQYQHAFMDESLANYLSIVYFADQYGAQEANKQANLNLRLGYFDLLFQQGDEVVDQPTDDFPSEHAYGVVIYGKGALAFMELRREIGTDAFFAGLQRYYRDFAFQVAEPQDMKAAFEAASGQDLTGFWSHWFDQPDGADDFDATDLARLLREIGE
jgi:peptidase M1-like protein